MPSIEELSKVDLNSLDAGGMSKIPSQTPYVAAAQNMSVANPYLRCPTPVVNVPSVDDLQMYDRKGLIPQYRVYPT